MNQLDLIFEKAVFDALRAPPMARRTDPETSHAAAADAKELQADHYLRIVGALKTWGSLGKDGIASRCGLTSYQVSKRLTELQRLGLIRWTGRTVPSAAGRAEREWMADPK